MKRPGGDDEQFVPDSEAPSPKYDEPDLPAADDRIPPVERSASEGRTLAQVRMRVERLLLRREAAAPEAWAALGPDARQLLPRMLDDPAVERHEAVRQKLIATLAQLEITAAIPRLGRILVDPGEAAATRAYAANALGRIGDPSAVPLLGVAAADKEDMVRRQVARALGAVDHVDAVPHLMAMKDDASAEVATTAADELVRYETATGMKLGGRRRPPTRAQSQRSPAAERDA